MNTAFFTLLTDTLGYRFATFETEKERKVIEGFDRIPYTPETLLEDILSGFPAISDYRKLRYDIDVKFGESIDWLFKYSLWDSDEKSTFSDLIYLKIYNNTIDCYINANMASYAEIYFYKEMLSRAKAVHKNWEVNTSVLPFDEFVRMKG